MHTQGMLFSIQIPSFKHECKDQKFSSSIPTMLPVDQHPQSMDFCSLAFKTPMAHNNPIG
jgi:hypothetical protein